MKLQSADRLSEEFVIMSNHCAQSLIVLHKLMWYLDNLRGQLASVCAIYLPLLTSACMYASSY